MIQGTHFTDWLLAVFALFQVALIGAQAYIAHLQRLLAERTLNDIERPWVFRREVHIVWRDTPGRRYNDFWVSLKWKNIGRMPALVEACEFKMTEFSKLPQQPDYAGLGLLTTISSLPVGDEFETGPVGITDPEDVMREYVIWGRLIYRELNGRKRVSGFAVRLVPFACGALEHNSQAYNYYT